MSRADVQIILRTEELCNLSFKHTQSDQYLYFEETVIYSDE